MNINLYNQDCLEMMLLIPDNSIDMILTDPPYGTIKGIGKSSDFGMTNNEWDNIINIEEMFKQCERILRPNGCLALFGQEPFTSKIITSAVSNLDFSYRSIWIKKHFANSLSAKKAPVNYYEDIMFFFKKPYDKQFTSTLRVYSSKIKEFIGKRSLTIHKELGHFKNTHFFTKSFQFHIPTEMAYQELIDFYKINLCSDFIPYNELKEIFKKEKEQNPKVFNLPQGQKIKSNIYNYAKDPSKLHPTQKPVALLEDLIKTYSNEGMTVLDFTMGSGSTGVACVNTGRNFIGCELDEKFYEIAFNRIFTK